MLLDIADGRVQAIGPFYKATELLGTGRFADVYKAFDSLSQTEVALKIYREADAKALSMAKQENEVLRSLSAFNTGYFPEARRFLTTRISNRNHPVIVQEIGYYIASSTKQVIRLKDILSHKDAKAENRLPEFWHHENLYPWIIALCGAVVTMHKNNIIHRDLKPDNILLKKGAGLEHSVPFILDFNTSVRAELKPSSGGTEHYLPPEVRSGKRTEAVVADDLWALATVIGEIFLGVGQKVAEDAEPQQFLFSPFPEALLEVLMKALALDPTARFLTADVFQKAIEAVLISTEPDQKLRLIGLDELSWARKSSERVRNLIIDELSGENELPIPKDIRELVAVIYSSISEENTRSFDIKDDIIHLGPRAIPAVLENAYKVHQESKDYGDIVLALAELARQDLKLLERSISYYCMSSSISVRSMCRTLCDRVGIFPEALFELLSQDNGLLLPRERVELADLCIRYSKDDGAFPALSTYMCREYILDRNRYRDLRQRVANRMGDLQFERKAQLIVEDATVHIWEDLKEFEKVRESNRHAMENGLLQLFGDAFASMGDEALKLLENGQVPSRCTQNRHYILRLFARKLADSYPPAKQWLSEKFKNEPNNRDLSYALRITQDMSVPEERMRESFARYIQDGNNSDRQNLCHQEVNLVFELIREQLQIPNDLILKRLLDLLKSFEFRSRDSVVDIVLEFWENLSNVNYETLVDILVLHRVPENRYDTARECLQRDMTTEHREDAPRGLNILLNSRN